MSASRLRQLIRAVEQDRLHHVDAILNVQGTLRPASFVIMHRKCGKSNCHCATGEGHLTTYLSLKEEGRTRMIYVPAHMRERLSMEVHRYRTLRQHRAALAKLAQRSLQLIDQLQISLQTKESNRINEKEPRQEDTERSCPNLSDSQSQT